MLNGESNWLTQMGTTCGSLLNELQIIWDEMGESDAERDRLLLELEQECLEAYRRKVDQANRGRAQLRKAIADAEAELAAICSAMGEGPVHIRQSDHIPANLKAELRAILPQIEEMRKRKLDRKNLFVEVLEKIQCIKNEINGSMGFASVNTIADETDLSLKKLDELQKELQVLHEEKNGRLKLVMDHLKCLYSLCSVLGLDFKHTVNEIHPSLGDSEASKNINSDTIKQLGIAIQRLRETKIHRMQQLQDLTTSLLELWNLMDTPIEEQQIFQKATCNLASSEDEITEPDMLSTDFITYVKTEVSRLEELKVSKMKELVLKKKAELEDICRKTHLLVESDSAVDIAVDAIESGAVDAAYVLEQIELQIATVKEEALGRKEILEKVEKWKAACEEESWLEEYNRDVNRYNAGRGTHLTLKRAERARALVNKLPAMVDALASKTIAWENEKGVDFVYDGVCLLSMLEGYTLLRQEKELEHKRQRDQKKLQGQLLTEQEALYGSKPSPMKNQNVKKAPRLSCGGASNRRLSLGGHMLQTPKPDDMPHSAKATPNTRNAKRMDRTNQDRTRDDGFTTLSSGSFLDVSENDLNTRNAKRMDRTNKERTRDDGFTTLSSGSFLDVSGRMAMGITCHPVKKNSLNSSNAREIESPIMRKPFSPISSMDSSKFNATNTMEDLNKKYEMSQKILTPFSTPSKMISTTDEENRTPQTMVIAAVPSTPSTISVPMKMAITPAPSVAKSMEEETEYSFEERRAGFVLTRSRQMNVIQA